MEDQVNKPFRYDYLFVLVAYMCFFKTINNLTERWTRLGLVPE